MKKNKCNCKYCFYCDMPLATKHEHDHFPVPRMADGKVTVPSCLNCHDLKDRLTIESWLVDSSFKAFKNMTPEARIMTAKVLRMYFNYKSRFENKRLLNV